jgi:hypothetical protein
MVDMALCFRTLSSPGAYSTFDITNYLQKEDVHMSVSKYLASILYKVKLIHQSKQIHCIVN